MKLFTNSSNIFPLLPSIVAFTCLIVSCSKEPIRETPVIPDPTDSTPVATTYEHGVFVVNEGNFNWGNASVTFIDNSGNNAIQDIYKKANDRSLGDVAQSMTVIGTKGYIVVNNSNRVEVVNLKDFKSVKSIDGFSSPRYFEAVDANKAYVTNLQHNISIINLTTNVVSGVIKTTSWTESLIHYKDYMYVTSVGSFSEPNSNRRAQIYVISTKEDRIIDSIQTGKEPLGMVIDKKEKLWVLCTGGYDNFEAPSLVRINPELKMIEKAYVFPAGQGVPSKLCINPTGDTLYFLNGGVFQMPVTSAGLPSQPFISSNGRLFYGLAIHPKNGTIYVSDAIDYVQNGRVLKYSATIGSKLAEYQAGRIPGSFSFTDSGKK